MEAPSRPEPTCDDYANDLLDEIRMNVAAGYMSSAVSWYVRQMQKLYRQRCVTIEVLGGVAEVTDNPANIPVEIIDHDNGNAE